MPGIQNNVQWNDYYNLDLRLSKVVNLNFIRFELFMDISNALNRKYFSSGGYGFKDGNDFDDYMRSLHLPNDIGEKLQYGNIPGEDRPGDFRTSDIEMVPIAPSNVTASISVPVSSYIYYDFSSKKYLQYKNNAWFDTDQTFVDKVLNDKAYIDMPNLGYFTF